MRILLHEKHKKFFYSRSLKLSRKSIGKYILNLIRVNGILVICHPM